MTPGRDSSELNPILRVFDNLFFFPVIQRIVFSEKERRHCLNFLGNGQTLDSDGMVKSDMWGPQQQPSNQFD